MGIDRAFNSRSSTICTCRVLHWRVFGCHATRVPLASQWANSQPLGAGDSEFTWSSIFRLWESKNPCSVMNYPHLSYHEGSMFVRARVPQTRGPTL